MSIWKKGNDPSWRNWLQKFYKFSGSLCHFSGFDATGTHIDFSDTPGLYQCPNPLQVGIETPFVQIVGMTDIVANQRFFAANSTFF
jgi:hypothetical protein